MPTSRWSSRATVSGSAWAAALISWAAPSGSTGRPHTIIGVSPAGFSGISGVIAPEIWIPLGLHTQIVSAFSESNQVLDLNNAKNYTLNVMARLAPGLSLDTAQSRLPVVAARLTSLQPHDAIGTRELQLKDAFALQHRHDAE